VVCEVVARLCAQEGQVQPAAGERVGQIRRVVAGDRDLNVLQFVVYAGSKDAVEGITKSVALETAKSGIRVNAVAPGPAYTEMLTRFTGTPANKASLQAEVPMGRLARTEELANAIVFIASGQASYVTGHIFNVDGGHTIS
jgi:NAD(P)-dependent dehydrogenase (short-subunit alcohol dehydrogenase family)